jgi:hypothetical protein
MSEEAWRQLTEPNLEDPQLTEKISDFKDSETPFDNIDKFLMSKVHTPILTNNFIHIQANVCPLCDQPSHALYYCGKCNAMRCRTCWKEFREELECTKCNYKIQRNDLTFCVYFKNLHINWDYRRIPFFYFK